MSLVKDFKRDDKVLAVMQFGQGWTAYEIRLALWESGYGDCFYFDLYPVLYRFVRQGLVTIGQRQRSYLPQPKMEFSLTLEGIAARMR